METAVRIEEKRDIVFPETTVIIRDIMRLQDAIARREGRAPLFSGALVSKPATSELEDSDEADSEPSFAFRKGKSRAKGYFKSQG